MKNKWLRKLLGGLSLTTAAFIFQACYGTDQDMEPDIHLEGKVASRASGLPITGIKVTLDGMNLLDTTNQNGEFSIFTRFANSYKLIFEDVDSTINGSYQSHDTIVSGDNVHAFVNVLLDNK
jgi:hypothetical protein